MTGHRKQKTVTERKDVTVTLEDGSQIRHKDGTNWAVISNNNHISEMLLVFGEKVLVGDQLVNEQLGTYRKWAYVGWTGDAK